MDRVYKIVNLLLNSNAPVTIDAIADRLNVSSRTIRKDINAVQRYVEHKGLNLNRKPGVGIEISGPQNKRLELINDMEIDIGSIEPYSPLNRKNYILKRLFTAEETITIKDLAKELFMSEATIRKDLDDVEDWLKDYNLKLIRKKNFGIEISGEEEDWRNAAASCITIDGEKDELTDLISQDYTGKLDFKTTLKLKELIDIDYAKLEEIVMNAERRMKFSFSDEAFTSLIIHIAISIRRLEDGKDICLSESILKELKSKDEYVIAEQIAGDVEKAYNIKLPEQEVGYILLHILGAKMQHGSIENLNLDLEDGEDDDLAVIMAKDIISIAGKALSMDLSNDKQLLNGLILHLRPTINRLEYGLNLTNPIIDEIKQNYPEIYGVAWLTNIVFERYLNKPITEAEIGYIVLHLCAAVERQKKPLRAILVCTSGIGTSQLLAVRIERLFRQIEIKEITSIMSLNEKKLKDIDVIISTVQFMTDKPLLIISPLLTQKDIKMLEDFISKIEEQKFGQEEEGLICNDFIQLDAAYKDKNDLLKAIGTNLFCKGYVKEEYISDLMRREKSASTYAGNRVAIPHGLPKYVYKSVIAVTVLEKPMQWGAGGLDVDIVFTLCISESEINKYLGLIKKLYKKIDNPEFLDAIKNCKSKNEIKQVMDGVFNNNEK